MIPHSLPAAAGAACLLLALEAARAEQRPGAVDTGLTEEVAIQLVLASG